MRTETMHVAIAGGDTSVGHHNGHLVQGFGKHGPIIPIRLWRTKIGMRVTLYSMVQVRELQGIADEEYRCIVAHQIPIAFFGVEFYGKSSDVPFGIGGSPFSRYGGETDEHFRLLSDFGE